MNKRKLNPSEWAALHEIIECDANTGVLRWKVRDQRTAQMWGVPQNSIESFNGRYPGKELRGSPTKDGSRLMSVMHYRLAAHRVCWAVHYREAPPDVIDHINGNPADNRIANLRAATLSQNQFNRGVSKNNRSGLKGAIMRPRGKWEAKIVAHGVATRLGSFNCPTAAHLAYMKAAKQMHGEFWRQR